jgi:hypothetical protein
MKLAILMPVVLQTEILRNITQEAVSHLRSQHQVVLYIICNRLHVCTPEILRADLQNRFQGRVVVVHEPGVERSVAGAWNKGPAGARTKRSSPNSRNRGAMSTRSSTITSGMAPIGPEQS